MSIQLLPGLANESLDRVLEDLLVRFVVNASAGDLSTNARVFFLFEEAHWFYLDHCRAINPHLPNLKMKGFCKKLIEVCPIIWKGGDPTEGLKEFVSYKQSIPVRGAALFNSAMTKILLVQGVESVSWSFPRGKISKDEEDADCAIREVKEEIGLDITPYLNKDDYIERTVRGKNYKIYLCRNLPEDFNYEPIVKNEIRSISWMDFKKIRHKIEHSNQDNNKFFLVNAMLHPMQQWIKKNKGEYNETQLKLEVEAQLKSMLGLEDQSKQDSQKPKVDPGRDLLDFIRKSSASKHLKDVQQQIHESKQIVSQTPPPSQQQQQQQQQLQPQQFQQQQFPFPFPPPGQGQFLPPGSVPMFMPPIPMYPNSQNGPTPLFANYLPMLQHQPVLSPHPHQHPHHHLLQSPQQHEAHAPNANQLSRPSSNFTITKNEDQSRELLSILNNKSNKSNASELLSLLGKKNTQGEDKRSSNAEGKEKKSGSEHSKYLLGLLSQSSKTNENKEENTPSKKAKVVTQNFDNAEDLSKATKVSTSSASQDLLSLIRGSTPKSTSRPETPPVKNAPDNGPEKNKAASTQKPKLKILKRNEEIPAPAPASANTSSEVTQPSEFSLLKQSYGNTTNPKKDEADNQPSKAKDSSKPSKELVALIKKTQKRPKEEDYEVFEEFSSDEEFFESEDDEAVEYDEEENEENEQYETYEQFEEEILEDTNDAEPYEFEPETHSQQHHNFNDLTSRFHGVGNGEIPPPFEENSIRTPPVIDHFDKVNLEPSVVVQDEPKKPKKLMMLKRGQKLDELLSKSDDSDERSASPQDTSDKSEEQGDAGHQENGADDETSGEEYEDTYDNLADIESTIKTESTVPNVEPKNGLLNFLHNGGSSVSTTAATTDSAFDLTKLESNLDAIESRLDNDPPVANSNGENNSRESSAKDINPSKTLLGLLHREKSKSELLTPPTQGQGQTELEETVKLDLPQLPHSVQPVLPHQNSSENQNSSQFLLSLLKRPSASPSSTTPTVKSPPQAAAAANPGNDLLKLLHKVKSPEPAAAPLSSPTSQTNNGGGHDLLNLLHKKKSTSPPPPEPRQDSSSISNASNELLGLLHRKPTTSSLHTESVFPQQENQEQQEQQEQEQLANDIMPQPVQFQQQPQVSQSAALNDPSLGQHGAHGGADRSHESGTRATDLLSLLHGKK
jgi:mRNA-decapping enzyme subunit 2